MKGIFKTMLGFLGSMRCPIFVNWLDSGSNWIADALSRDDFMTVKRALSGTKLVNPDIKTLKKLMKDFRVKQHLTKDIVKPKKKPCKKKYPVICKRRR